MIDEDEDEVPWRCPNCQCVFSLPLENGDFFECYLCGACETRLELVNP